jgi:hypothetical protein
VNFLKVERDLQARRQLGAEVPPNFLILRPRRGSASPLEKPIHVMIASSRPRADRAKIFTDRRIHRAPDCAATDVIDIHLSMPLSPPVSLSDAEKLDVLRRLDQFRQWRSLDDKRYCLVCGNIVTGREIKVTGGTRGNGALRLICPTERCHSIPMDWVLPTDEILATVEIMAAQECKAAASRPSARVNGGPERPDKSHYGIASRLRRFGFHFGRASKSSPLRHLRA